MRISAFLYRTLLVTLLVLLSIGNSKAQSADVGLASPFDFPLQLSANFAELRSGHFHAGVDFKTQGVVGKPIKCVADGYVCRARVQAGGYGLALYVMHDTLMTVYGHLDSFPDSIAKRVREYQYSNECFAVDLNFQPGEFPVKRGEFLAYAGNSGYSFGPHLHFELRDSSGQRAFNPLAYYIADIVDCVPPRATSVAVYPRLGKGLVCGDVHSKTFGIKGTAVPDTIDAWGCVAFGISALDYMDGTANKYGIYRIELLVDGKLCFKVQMDDFSFDEYSLIKACVDRGRSVTGEGTYQRLFLASNNPFKNYVSDDTRGWVTVDEERFYDIECRLVDYHGNTSIYKIPLRGRRGDIPESLKPQLRWSRVNLLTNGTMLLRIPAFEMFENMHIAVTTEPGGCRLDGHYSVTGDSVIFWHGAELSLKADTLLPESKMCILKVVGNDTVWAGGKYSEGRVHTTISSLGYYIVSADTVPPVIKPVNEKNWVRNGEVVFKLSDKGSMVSSYRGTLDGKFVLFKYSSMNRRLVLNLREENILPGVYELEVTVTDAYGNESIFRKTLKINKLQ